MKFEKWGFSFEFLEKRQLLSEKCHFPGSNLDFDINIELAIGPFLSLGKNSFKFPSHPKVTRGSLGLLNHAVCIPVKFQN
jgi:hypothetical protein